MARGGLFHFGQADNTEEDYLRRKQEEAAAKEKAKAKPEDLGSGAAKKAAQELESRAARLKRLEEEAYN